MTITTLNITILPDNTLNRKNRQNHAHITYVSEYGCEFILTYP